MKPGSTLEQEFRLWQWLGEWPEAREVDSEIFAEMGKNQELVRVYLETKYILNVSNAAGTRQFIVTDFISLQPIVTGKQIGRAHV